MSYTLQHKTDLYEMINLTDSLKRKICTLSLKIQLNGSNLLTRWFIFRWAITILFLCVTLSWLRSFTGSSFESSMILTVSSKDNEEAMGEDVSWDV